MNRNKKPKRISLGKDLEKPRWKVLIMGVPILLLLAAVSVKALYVQVLDRERALQIGKAQVQGSYTLLPRRGKIFDIGMKELAVNVEAESIYLRPQEVKDRQQAAKKLSKQLRMSEKEASKLLLSKSPFVWIKRLVDPSWVERVKNAGLEGIHFIEEPKRLYPNNHLAAQVLGFTNVDSKGIEGIEYYLDGSLSGKPGKVTIKKDALGGRITDGFIDVEKSISGQSVVLTIDSQIQHVVEKELKEGAEKTGARKGMAVLMNPETGSILAMASYPFFDPNNAAKYPEDVWRNLPVWYSFEPGSTVKVFLLAAALEEKKVNSDSRFDCEGGRRKVGPSIINDVHPYDVLTVAEIIKVSSNICAGKIAEVLGKNGLYDYLRAFGIGERTGIELPGESKGKLTKPSEWGPVEFATLSFGQGMSVTAVQLASALSIVANGGYLMKPRIVEKIIGFDGNPVGDKEAEATKKVISYDTAREVTRILESVVEDGTGKNASIPGYRVAGKTGTAQVPNPKTGGYHSDRYISSFMGFVPSDDPKITLVVILEDPKTSAYGGEVAAPIFKAIAEKVLFYLRVPPQKGFAGMKIMPDLRGKSARDVLSWAEEEGVKVKLNGSGYAAEQKPRPGEKIKDDTVCSIQLKQAI